MHGISPALTCARTHPGEYLNRSAHFKDIERVAMVGETKWQHGMAIFCKPFTTASIRYFDHAAVDQARAWLTSL